MPQDPGLTDPDRGRGAAEGPAGGVGYDAVRRPAGTATGRAREAATAVPARPGCFIVHVGDADMPPFT